MLSGDRETHKLPITNLGFRYIEEACKLGNLSGYEKTTLVILIAAQVNPELWQETY